MKISKEQIVGFIIIALFFVLIGFTVELPVIGFAPKKVTLFEAVSPIELFFICLTITLVYFLMTYFISPSGVLQQLKSYKEPFQRVQNEKFKYWIDSLLYEDELQKQNHLFDVESIQGRIESGRINVLVETANLNDMTVSTFLKHLTTEAEINLTNAKTKMELTKVHNDLDIQRDISGYVKELKEQEVKKAKAETEAFEQKMKQEQKKYTTNDKV